MLLEQITDRPKGFRWDLANESWYVDAFPPASTSNNNEKINDILKIGAKGFNINDL